MEEITVFPASGRPSTPLISVCIPNYNGAEYIERCLTSVLSQEVDAVIEILVHDDASMDDSIAIIRSRFPTVEILSSKRNVGFCISNNRMVAHSRGTYALLLNNDAELRPGSLRALLGYSVTQEVQGILGLPQYTLYDGSLIDRGYEFDIFMNPIPVFTHGPTEVGTVTGACLWIPRKVWDEIGGFPAWFESIAEDIFLCHAARLLGYPVVVLAEPGFDHWIGRSLGGGKVVKEGLISTTRRRALSEKNKVAVMAICYPIALLFFILPLHWAFLAMEAAALLATGTRWQQIRTIYLSLPTRLLNDISFIKTARQRIQRHRRLRSITYIRRFRLMPWKLIMLIRHGFPEVR